jgi:hypothetical protein
MTNSGKAFASSIILTYTEDLLQAEDGKTVASIKHRKRLTRIIGEVVKISDYYLPEEGFCREDVNKAIAAVDYINGEQPDSSTTPE